MSNVVDFLTGNLILNLSILAWAIAQVLKFVITLISQGKLDWRHILSSGGMPSSHSAFVCACAAAMGYMYGWASPVFTISAVRRGQCPQGGGGAGQDPELYHGTLD